jgi:hypothetical protein
MNQKCIQCDLKQIDKLHKIINFNKKEVKTLVLEYLKTCDMNKTNPEIMGEIWQMIIASLHYNDPYKDIKHEYNLFVLSIENELLSLIENNDNPLLLALKLAIIGNIIDFAAQHTFNKEILLEQLRKANDIHLTIDYSNQLINDLHTCKNLLYIGDNCGEIVLDKLLLKTIKHYNPDIDIYYGVRGYPIVNDVTIEDAYEVGMEQIANIVSNGSYCLGTVLSLAGKEFNDCFNQVDIVIAVGQGNYEGLRDINKNIYYLFMAKCDFISQSLNINTMSLVCLKESKKIRE